MLAIDSKKVGIVVTREAHSWEPVPKIKDSSEAFPLPMEYIE